MKMRYNFLIFTIIILILPGSIYASGNEAFPDELNNLINELIENNKKFSALEKRAMAIKEGADPAGALPDPVLGIGIANLPVEGFDFNSEPMTQKQIFISQNIPWLSKLNIKSEIEIKKFYREKAFLDLEKAYSARKLADMYFDFLYLNKEISAVNQLIIIVEDIINSVDSAYSSGRLGQQDILMAMLELERLRDRKISIQKEKNIIEIRINKILNRGSFKRVQPGKDMNFPVFDHENYKIHEKALHGNPELMLLKKIKRVDMEIVKLFQKSNYPDMGFKAVYGQRGEDSKGNNLSDFFSLSASFTIPLWKEKSQEKRLSSAKKNQEASSENIKNFIIELSHGIEEIKESLKIKKERLSLHEKSIIPAAEKLSIASLNDYRVGREDFNNMMRKKMEIIKLRLKADKIKIDAQRDVAEILYLTGEILSGGN